MAETIPGGRYKVGDRYVTADGKDAPPPETPKAKRGKATEPTEPTETTEPTQE